MSFSAATTGDNAIGSVVNISVEPYEGRDVMKEEKCVSDELKNFVAENEIPEQVLIELLPENRGAALFSKCYEVDPGYGDPQGDCRLANGGTGVWRCLVCEWYDDHGNLVETKRSSWCSNLPKSSVFLPGKSGQTREPVTLTTIAMLVTIAGGLVSAANGIQSFLKGLKPGSAKDYPYKGMLCNIPVGMVLTFELSNVDDNAMVMCEGLVRNLSYKQPGTRATWTVSARGNNAVLLELMNTVTEYSVSFRMYAGSNMYKLIDVELKGNDGDLAPVRRTYLWEFRAT